MKLVKAICPSCGANIDVDKNSDKTKCEYCGSKIIVEDAIAKFKLNVSGSIEIKNLPKIEGYLKIGERQYKNYEYKEALESYKKALELDPDNALVVLRVGLCKSTLTTYNKFETNYAINALKDALKIETDDDKIKKYITETYACIFKLENLARNTWNSVNEYLINNINNHHERLNKCLIAYEYLFTIVKTKEFKITILNKIITIIKEILTPKKYTSYNKSNGNKNIKPYTIDLNFRNILNQKYQKYMNELQVLDPSQFQNHNIIVNKTNPEKYINIAVYCTLGFFILGAIATNKSPFFALLLIVATILYTLKIKNILLKNNQIIANIIIIVLGIIGSFGALLNTYPYFIDKEYTDQENNITIKLNRHDGTITTNDKDATYDLSYEKISDYTLITLGDYQLKYQNNYNNSHKHLLCILENNECKYFLVENMSSNTYISNIDEYQEINNN